TVSSNARIASRANKVLKAVAASRPVVVNISSVSNSLSALTQLPLQRLPLLLLKAQLQQRLERLKAATLNVLASAAKEANVVNAADAVAVVVVVADAVVVATTETAVMARRKAAMTQAVGRQTAHMQTMLRPRLASRARVMVISAAAHRAGLSRSLAPKRHANRLRESRLPVSKRRVSTHLANIRASRPRLLLRSPVNPRVKQVATNTRCGVRPHRAAAAHGVARAARAAKSKRA
ncbi:MAG TPA: hypothetical protein VIU34_23625, partial [Steroidobacter sp.]